MFFGSLNDQVWVPVRQWKLSDVAVADDARARVLTTVGSLTRMLEREFDMPLKVEVEEQFIDHSDAMESMLLACANGTMSLRRKVALLYKKQVMFEAESVLPLQDIHMDLMADLERGEIPLGSLLMDRGMSLSRTDLSITQIVGEPPFRGRWARQSILKSHLGTTALVVEVFHALLWQKLAQKGAVR
ncbi:MAG: chorismate lyase [Zetaproteobacteria bacterium]|nr:chorismate lyase [Zetaproteobacteria bacterium]